MVELSLPKNSKPKKGKAHPRPDGAKNTRTFSVYRYDPDTGDNPQIDTYEVDMETCGRWCSTPFSKSKMRWIPP